MIPVRCFSCGNLVGDKYYQFLDATKDGEDPQKTLDKLGLKEALIITEGLSENLYLGVRNIPKVDVMDTNEIDPYSLIGFEKVLITQTAVEKVEEWLS